MNRDKALVYVSFFVDAAGGDVPFPIDERTRLVGWQCGFEPLFVAVRSYLPNVTVDDDEATDLATDLLRERNWFAGDATEPDFIL